MGTDSSVSSEEGSSKDRREGGEGNAEVEQSRRGSLSYIESSIPIALAGAVAVSVFVFLLDVIAGKPLATPSALGAVIFRGEAFDLGAPVENILVFGYTILHTAAFIVAATAAITIEQTLKYYRVPARAQFFAGVVGLFAGLHGAVLVMMSLLDIPTQAFGGGRLIAINAVAAVVMATVFYVRDVRNRHSETNA